MSLKLFWLNKLYWSLLLLIISGSLSVNGVAETLEPPDVWTSREAVIFGLKNSPDSRIALQRIA